MLTIGDLTFSSPVVLAPMAGYTDTAFRTLCRRYGAGCSMTEVVNAAGLVHGSKPTFHLLETTPGEEPVGAHLYGNDPAVIAEAARLVEELGRFSFIDINAGCPVRKIVAKRCGAALMRDPARLGRIVAAVRDAVSLPVTVKTRIGFDQDAPTIVDIARAATEAGADALSVHARYAVNHHKGPADWALLASIKAASSIPIIGNGGADCAADVPRLFAATGVDGVMIGRAAVGRPWIFAEAQACLAGDTYLPPNDAEQRAIILEHLDALTALKEKERLTRRRRRLDVEASAALHFRAHLFKYLSGRPGWAAVRRSLQHIKSRDAVMEAVDRVLA